jgi:hypothetical protein
MRSHAMGLPTALWAFALLLVSPAAAQEAWHTLTVADGSFTVELPRPPRYMAALSATGTMDSYLVELDGDRTYLVAAVFVPQGIDTSKHRLVLERGVEDAATRMESGKFAKVEWKKHQGAQAFDAIGRTRSGRELRTYGVIKGKRLVILTYASAPGTAYSADVNRFIASLRIR